MPPSPRLPVDPRRFSADHFALFVWVLVAGTLVIQVFLLLGFS